jgi:hypothetical protein
MEPNSAMLQYTGTNPMQAMIKFQNKPAVPPFSKLSDKALMKVSNQNIVP